MTAVNDTVDQPASFAFTEENVARADTIIAKYPEGRQASAVMPLLHLAQRQNDGWLPRAAMDYIADYLGMAPIRVYEVATFYTMYNLKPVGRHHVQVCTNLSCWLRGSDEIVAVCEHKLGIKLGDTTEDGMFTLSEVECLCACVNAPIVQIGDDFYEDLTPDTIDIVLDKLRAGGQPKPGSQIGRRSSEPITGLTSLTSLARAPSGGASEADGESKTKGET
jgi:NADH-quinone oxidoreductase E subunit